jgi:hypothetical protein
MNALKSRISALLNMTERNGCTPDESAQYMKFKFTIRAAPRQRRSLDKDSVAFFNGTIAGRAVSVTKAKKLEGGSI